MKHCKPIVSLLLALALALSLLTVPALAAQTSYEPTDAYVLNYNGVYEGSKWQYFSPYWPAYTYDGVPGETQSISFTLYNTVSGEGFPTYCTDLLVGLDSGSDFRRINLEDSVYAAAAAGLLRSVMLAGFPQVPADELGRAAGVAELTVGEAVAATQAAVWLAAHGQRVAFTDLCSYIDTQWSPDATEYFDACYAEIENGYAAAENEAAIESRIEKVVQYLMGLEPTAPRATAVSAASFQSWSEPALTANADGTYDVAVTAQVFVEMAQTDSLTLSAVMDGGAYYASAALQNGSNTVTLTVEAVPAAMARGGVMLAIDGVQTVSDVFLFDAEGERGESQTLIGVDGSTLPVHAEVRVEPERILHFYKTTKVANTQGGYDRVPLEGITFDIWLAAELADYLSGKEQLPEAEDYAPVGLPDYTAVTDADGRCGVNLTKNGLPDGVYLVVERPHPAISAPVEPFYVILPATAADGVNREYEVTVQPKNEIRGEVDIEKDVISIGNDEASVDAYAPHTWIIGAAVPVDMDQGKHYEISDTLDSRLDFLGNVRVQAENANSNAVAPTVLVQGEDYVLSVTDNDSLAEGKPSDSFTVALTRSGMQKAARAAGADYDSWRIRVYFEAQINANAQLGQEIPNRAKLDYTNSVGFEFDVESDIPCVCTGGVGLLKVDGDDQETVLSGAEFRLYRAATAAEQADEAVEKSWLSGISVPVVEVSFFDNAALAGEKVSAAVSGTDGRVALCGLAYGTYYLVETRAPEGYNLLHAPAELTVDGESHHQERVVTVINRSGVELPDTGGVGVAVFTVTGLGMMVAAGVLLAQKKRKEEQSEE